MVYIHDCFKNEKLARFVAAVYIRHDDSKSGNRKKYMNTCKELLQHGLEII
jgi:hypothetical protein